MRTIIVTVGTSLLTNSTDERPWRGWQYGQDLPGEEVAARYVESADEQLISAETNTLQALPSPLQERDSLVFLHSATPAGRWCGKVLSTHYQKSGYECDLFELGGLGYDEVDFARGLKSLLHHTFEIIKKSGAENTVLCATGGFKAEIAFINMVGMLAQVPVYYIHERFRELVELPPIPISWDISVVGENIGFFEWIDAEPRPSAQAESWLRADPQLRIFVSSSLDGNTYLSPVGDLLFGAYKVQDNSAPKAVWPPASKLAPSEKIALEGTDHHRPKGWQNFVQRMAEIDCTGLIRYDGGGNKKLKSSSVYGDDAATGQLKVLLADAKYPLPLIVETTARGAEQLDLVKNYLQRQIRNWK